MKANQYIIESKSKPFDNFVLIASRWQLGWGNSNDDRLEIGRELISALQSCRSLRRFAIVCHDEKVAFHLADEVFDWPSARLVFAAVVSPSIAKTTSSRFRITSPSPAFQCYVGHSESNRLVAEVHYKEMFESDWRVARLPF